MLSAQVDGHEGAHREADPRVVCLSGWVERPTPSLREEGNMGHWDYSELHDLHSEEKAPTQRCMCPKCGHVFAVTGNAIGDEPPPWLPDDEADWDGIAPL